jgi:hypothetical protein
MIHVLVGLSGSLYPRLLLKINEQTVIREGSMYCVSTAAWEPVSGERPIAREGTI